MSLSLALGILVSDLRGYKFLTSAHAQETPCGEPTDFGNTVQIGDGVVMSGLAAHGLLVNGELIENGVIAGSVRIVDSTVVNAYEIPGDNASTSGVVVGSGDSPTEEVEGGGSPCTNGVVVGSGDSPKPTGVVVGSGDSPKPTGVVVGGGNVMSLTSVIVGGGTATGGLLTGDDISVTDGVITGANLVLTGATIHGGSIYAAAAD